MAARSRPATVARAFRMTAAARRSASADSSSDPQMPPAGQNRSLEFLSAMWALDHALHRMSKRMAASTGVTGPQRLVVRVLGRHPHLTAGALAKMLHLHPSTVTGLIDRLERDGLVRRQVDDDDRRATRVSLTPRGARLDHNIAGTIEAAIDTALGNSANGDVEIGLRLLAQITDALRKGHEKLPARPPRAGSG